MRYLVRNVCLRSSNSGNESDSDSKQFVNSDQVSESNDYLGMADEITQKDLCYSSQTFQLNIIFID